MRDQDKILRERRRQTLLESQRKDGSQIGQLIKLIGDVLDDAYACEEYAVLACALAEVIIEHTSFPQVCAKAMRERMQDLIARHDDEDEANHG
jgi:hypothetical protein